MAFLRDHRERAHAILDGSHGVTSWTITAGQFTRAHSTVLAQEADACERVVDVRIPSVRPLAGYNNPCDGRDLSVATVIVRVAYVLTESGNLDTYDAVGGQSGGASPDEVESRASLDAQLITRSVGYQPNWSGLTPEVIDCAPSPDGWVLELGDDRGILTVPFEMTFKAALPGSYGPSLT